MARIIPAEIGTDPISERHGQPGTLMPRCERMPRTARVVVPDVALHVRQRGNNGLPCFYRSSDYQIYLRYLLVFAARFGCMIHAYCLMTNHVHLLLTPRDMHACARLMKHLGQCYVQTLNKSLARTGTLWEGRFRSCLVPTPQYVLACYRYIELNPVQAGMVANAHDYPWSSHLANAAGRYDPLVSPHPAVHSLGRDAYRNLFDLPLDAAVIAEIRKATRNGHCLGMPQKRRGRRSAEIGTDPISAEMGSVPISD
jgi:putative transposase